QNRAEDEVDTPPAFGAVQRDRLRSPLPKRQEHILKGRIEERHGYSLERGPAFRVLHRRECLNDLRGSRGIAGWPGTCCRPRVQHLSAREILFSWGNGRCSVR